MTSRTRRIIVASLAVSTLVGFSVMFVGAKKSPSVQAIAKNATKSTTVVNVEPQTISTTVSATPALDMIAPTSVKAPAPQQLPSSVPKIVVLRGTTLTTPTHSGKQTLTVRTNRVKISVSPAVVPSGTPVVSGWKPSDSLPVPGMIPDPSTTNAPLPQADWSGYIAPSMSWDGWISCVRSPEKMLVPNGGNVLTYVWTLTGRIKVSGGNYVLLNPETGEIKKMNPSDVFFIYPTPGLASDTMNPDSNPFKARIQAYITAMPMNRDASHSWETRVTAFDQAITYSQGSCP